ncbi:hypothetical protein QD357_27890 [Rhizobium sp. BR 317]|uniref:hypothetical protein n=1 Tax=Rhizobium sp. BR 317 TaxID=3040015 RepID=UPI0039BF599D
MAIQTIIAPIIKEPIDPAMYKLLKLRVLSPTSACSAKHFAISHPDLTGVKNIIVLKAKKADKNTSNPFTVFFLN